MWKEEMSIHGVIDSLAVGLGATFMPKYFRDGYRSQGVAENIEAISMDLPKLEFEGDHEIAVETSVGTLDAAFRLARPIDPDLPWVIYHHGAAETPFDYGFNRIFPLKKQSIDANLVLVRAPFHRSMKEFQRGIRTLENVVAMLAVSTCLIEQLVQESRKVGEGRVLVAGTSLGGFITNLHHIHFNSADVYTPLLAGLAMYDAYLNSVYSRATAVTAKDNPRDIKAVLDFTTEFAGGDCGNVFPLLALHDRLVRYEIQRTSYGDCPVTTISKGHTTGALAYSDLREHILGHL